MYERLLGFISQFWINQLKNPRTSCMNIKKHIYMEDLMKTGLKWKLIGPYYGSKILLHRFVSRGIVFSSKASDRFSPTIFLYHWDLLELSLLTVYKLLKLRKQDRHQSEKKTSHVTSVIFRPSKTCKVGPPSQVLEITTTSLVLRVIASVSNQHLPHFYVSSANLKSKHSVKRGKFGKNKKQKDKRR